MSQNKVIVITGDIACGKSTVASYLTNHRYQVLSTDDLTHQLYEKEGELYVKIIEIFSHNILDAAGHIDRKKLGNIVFSDKEKLKILEDLTHTVIIDKVRKYIDNLTSEEKNVIFIEIPLYERAKELIHSKIKVDAVWYVSCRCEVQLERLMRRNHLSEQEANQRIKVQRQNHPTFDVLISNDGSIDSLYRKVQNLLDKEKL